MPQKILLIFKSVIPTGAWALFSRHKSGPLSANLPELPIPNSEEFEVGNGKITYIQKNPQYFLVGR